MSLREELEWVHLRFTTLPFRMGRVKIPVISGRANFDPVKKDHHHLIS